MNPSKKIKGTPEAWESGELGQSEEHVRKSPAQSEQIVEDTLDLQLISIRLQKDLIKELKQIARFHGVGYQPLIREVLGRFARSEMSVMAEEYRKQSEARAAVEAEKNRKRA